MFPNGNRGPSFPRLYNTVQSAIHDDEVRIARIPTEHYALIPRSQGVRGVEDEQAADGGAGVPDGLPADIRDILVNMVDSYHSKLVTTVLCRRVPY